MSTSSELLLERVRSATEDEYTIEGELGRGGMAAVFLARDKALERRVAIKVMLPDLIDVEGISDRFVIEARTAAHLDHPGIVTVYSVKQRAGLLFIVMKYVEGRTLEAVMRAEHGLEQSVVTTIVGQVAEALHFAHTENVIHRDVKPSNIIIDTKGRPIVTDFGIAKLTSGKSITVTGSMLGTPAYMSPEQCRGLPATAASDQYSLGVMTYEMLTQKLPFEGTIFELINAHCNEPPPPLLEAVPGIDAGLAEIVTRMLAKSPRDRWPSLTDVAKALAANVPHQPRRTSDMRAVIAALVRGSDEAEAPRRAPGIDLSAAATELATTPAPQLVVTPPDPSIEIGATVQLRVSESSGASLGGYKITWRSEDPTIATVDDNGLVTARSVGFAKITASGGAAFGRVAVTVKAPSVDTLVVTPQSPELETQGAIQFVATVLDARGTTLSGQMILWQSSDAAVCAVSGQGQAIGIAPGKATITAICGAVRGTAQIRVRLPLVERVTIEPGEASIEAEETRRLVASVFGANDRKLEGRAITWRSTVPTVVSVDAQGTIKGISPGTGAVIAECDGKQGLASIGVRNQPIVAVRIMPEQLKLEAGRSLQLKGVGEDRKGRSVTEKGLEWQSDDEQVALVDASGKVHAVREGRTLVRAVAGDITSSIEVTVTPREAAQVRIDAHTPQLNVGQFLTLDATVLDTDGAVLTGRPVTWKSDNENVIFVGADGVCEAKKPGSVRITASSDRARATTKLSVPTAVAAAAAAAAAAAPTTSMPAMSQPRSSREELAQPVPARRNLAVPVGGGVLALLVVVGGWFYMHNRGTQTVPVVTPPPIAATTDTTTKVAVQTPPPDPVPTPPTTTKAVAPPPDRKSPADPPGRSGSTPVTRPAMTHQDSINAGLIARSAPPPVTRPTMTRQDSIAAGLIARPAPPPVMTRQDSIEKGLIVVRPAPPPTMTRQDSINAGLVARSAPPPVTPPAGRGAADGDHAALCTVPATPATALTAALSGDAAAKLRQIYQPRDATDTKNKEALLSSLKLANGIRTSVSTIRPEAGVDGCDWVMKVDFSYKNGFGQTQKKTWEMRTRLEMAGGSPQVKSVFGAKSQ